VVELASGVLALVAAGLWLWSGWVALPNIMPLGAKNIEARELNQAVRKQSRLSGLAAISAGLAAISQLIVSVFH
jgi:hypothetical protein